MVARGCANGRRWRPEATFAAVDCLFCRIVAGQESAHLVWDSPDVLAFLDARPVFKGHTLIVPRRHVDNLLDLPEELMLPLMSATKRIAAAMQTGLSAKGSFVATNNTVSQSVPHLHVHVVPRTKGDGLRGFFWPRTKYADEDEAAEYAARLRAVVGP
jgi:histidine triad (HIT) family protein